MSASCYVCGSPTAPRQVGIARLEVCGSCGFARSAGAGATARDYWSRNADIQQELSERYWGARARVYRRALERVTAARGPGRVVDLGGGVGLFAADALALGWDAYSVDVSQHAARAATGRIGRDRSLVDVPGWLGGTCDLVTLWCVLAHVPDPRHVLAEAMRLLRPGGRLLLTTPNFVFQSRYAALAARLGRPVDFVASDHHVHFTPAALDHLLAGAGAARHAYVYWGTTEDCLLERRLARVLVPGKRAWNWMSWHAWRAGAPPAYSELQVEAFARA